MALQTSPSFKANDLEAIRYQLETTGYVEMTVIANGFDNDPAVLLTVDGQSLGTTLPVPPDSMVLATVHGAAYLDDVDGDTDFGEAVSFNFGGFRIGSGDVTDVEAVNTTNEINELAAALNTADAATAGQITIAAAADTTNQGIDVTLANDAATEAGYFVGRMKVVCAKKGGLAKKYTT